MVLASDWRFEEGDSKSDSCSTESEYENKLIEKSQKGTLCRLCKNADESIDHALLVVVANLHKRSIKEGMIT